MNERGGITQLETINTRAERLTCTWAEPRQYHRCPLERVCCLLEQVCWQGTAVYFMADFGIRDTRISRVLGVCKAVPEEGLRRLAARVSKPQLPLQLVGKVKGLT